MTRSCSDHPRRFLRAIATVLAGGLLWAVDDAHASGISVARFGGEHGHPTTDNPTAIYYNPAGIALSKGTHVFAELAAAWRHTTYDKSQSSTDATVPAGAEGANVGQATLMNFPMSPMAGVTHRLGDLVLGLAAFTPFGGQSEWSQNDAFSGNATYPGAVDGVQRWYSINGELRSTYFSLAGAYDFGPLQLGMSANLIYSVVNTLRARSPDGTNSLATEGRSWIDASSLDPSFGAGAVYQPIRDKLWVGASYQSRPNVVGGLKLDGTLKTVFANNTPTSNDVTFHEELPDVFRLGGRYRPTGDTELRLFFDYQRWSVLHDHCVAKVGQVCKVAADGSAAPGSEVILSQRRNWHDTFGARVGGSYWVVDTVELFTGGGFASNAIPDSTLEPALQDYNTFTVALGGRFGVTDWLRLAASYTQVIYLTRDTTGQSVHPTLASVSRGPDSSGRYAQQLGFVNLYAEAAF